MPVYRGNRHLENNNKNKGANEQLKTEKPFKPAPLNPEGFKLVTLNADINFNGNKSSEQEKKHRRRVTLRYSNSTSKPPRSSTTTIFVTPYTEKSSSTAKVLTTNFKREAPAHTAEVRRHDVHPIEFYNVKPETLNEELGTISAVGSSEPLRRFYRSSSEHSSKEMAVVNSEKVQVVRPTSSAKLVGRFERQKDAVDKLDEAVLGNLRFNRGAVSIITSGRRMSVNNQT